MKLAKRKRQKIFLAALVVWRLIMQTTVIHDSIVLTIQLCIYVHFIIQIAEPSITVYFLFPHARYTSYSSLYPYNRNNPR